MKENEKSESQLIRGAEIVVGVITLGAGLYKISENPQDWTKILAFMLIAIILSTVVLEFIKMTTGPFMKYLAKFSGVLIIGLIMISLVSLVVGWPENIYRNVIILIGLSVENDDSKFLNFYDGNSFGTTYDSNSKATERMMQISPNSQTSLMFTSSKKTMATGYFNIPIKLDKSFSEIKITIPQSTVDWGTRNIGNPSASIFQLFLFTEKPNNASESETMRSDNSVKIGSYNYSITNSDPFKIPKIEKSFNLSGVDESEIYLVMKFRDAWAGYPLSITIKDAFYNLK